MEIKSVENSVDLESVLGEFKLYGLYHIKYIVLIGILCSFSSAYCTNYIFAVEDINYRCKYTNCRDNELLSLQYNSSVDGRCRKYDFFDDNGTCTADNVNLFKSEECEEWVYEKPDSFVAEFNIGCEDWKRTLVGTVHSAGYMVGLLFVGAISDTIVDVPLSHIPIVLLNVQRIGRKNLIVFSAVAGGVIGITKSVVTYYWLYIALEFLEPLIGESYSPTYTLTVEGVTKENRVLIICIISCFVGFGQILKAVTAWLIPYWRNFLIAIYAPSLLFIVYIFLLDESVRWLLNKGKKEQVKRILVKAARLNKICIDETVVDNLKSEEKEANADLKTLLKITFTSKKLFFRLLSCVCLWFTALFNIYSLNINAMSLAGNKYMNYGFLSLSDLPASVILYYLLTKCKRKAPIILTLSMTGAFCMAQVFTPKEYHVLSILLYVMGKMTASIALRVVYLYTSELFPTYTRNTLHALCSSLGRIAAILAPQTPLLIRYWAGLPSVLVSILSLFTACLITLMPDTSDDVLPDNVKQAEALGQKEKEVKNCMTSRL